MSERYPLLCEDFSEEERYGPHFHRRVRPMNLKGRVHNHIKGAAAIITHWPEHWTSLLTYWWIGLAMIAVTTFIIYNSIFSMTMIQPTLTRPTKPSKAVINYNIKSLLHPTVFMHVFVNEKEEINLDKYIPYIEIIANEFKNFQYSFLIVINDTNANPNFSDEINNEVALKSLWNEDINYKKIETRPSNIIIKRITISNYLNDSPIKKYWRNLPHKFLEYLIRAVSIWEKGGIAINPVILTPQSPNFSYVEKVRKILQNYRLKDSKPRSLKQIFSEKNVGGKPKVNNIFDVINALEHEESVEHPNQEILSVAETRDKNSVDTSNVIYHLNHNESITPSTSKETENELTNNVQIIYTKSEQEEITNKNKTNIPLVLQYLFHTNDIKNSNNETNTTSRIRKSPYTKPYSENNTVQIKNVLNDLKSDNSYKPVIISAKGLFNNTDNVVTGTVSNDATESLFELTLDLKGNILATEVACHSFIGNMFINSIHHNDGESLTDFIIKELTTYCNGLLASCVGIDVILL